MKYKKFQNSLLIGMFEKYSMFCDITFQNINIFIKLLTFFQNGIQKNCSEPLDVLLHHQCVSMVTQCLVMNTRPHNSAQIYVFDLDVISFSNLHSFFSQRNTFYTSVTPTHTLRELSLSFSRSPFLRLPPDWGRFKIRQLARPIKPLRTDED